MSYKNGDLDVEPTCGSENDGPCDAPRLSSASGSGAPPREAPGLPKRLRPGDWEAKPYAQGEAHAWMEHALHIAKGSELLGAVRVSRLRLGRREVVVVEDTHHRGVPAFKLRGAEAFITLAHKDGARTFVAASTGNHGRGCARVASALGAGMVVFVPQNTPSEKVRPIRSLGAELIEYSSMDFEDTARAAMAFATAHRATFVPPYDDPRIIAGQGTLLVDVVQSLGTVPPVVVSPVGGGGLAAGLIVASHHYYHGAATVIGVEPEERPSLLAALRAGTPVPVPYADTVAQGANVGTIGAAPFPILRDGLAAAMSVSEQSIRDAMEALGRLGIVAEGAGALAFAAVMDGLDDVAPPGTPIVAIVSGASVPRSNPETPSI